MVDRDPAAVRELDRDDRPGTARLSEPRYLSAAELELLLARVSETFAIGTIAVTGQLSVDGERVPVKSAASAAKVPMLPALARELREHRSRQAGRDLRRVHADALVFTTSRGKPQSRRNALRAVHAASGAAGLNDDGRERVGLHDLRHSFVALALASNVSLAEVAALARHANPRVTAAVYAGLADSGREVAAAKLVEAGFGM